MFYDRAADGGVTSTGRQPDQSSRKGAFMAINPVSPSGGDSQSCFQCKKCGEVKLAEGFYSSDKGRCKECIKARVRANRLDKIEYYRSYDRMRYREDPDRNARCRAMGKTTPMKVRIEKQRERRRDSPERKSARDKVSRAIKNGDLKRECQCFFCGGKEGIQAHHPDYSKPLDVFWLCTSCHGKLHTINGDFHRPYPDNKSSSLHVENAENWQSIGQLARLLAEKAGGDA